MNIYSLYVKVHRITGLRYLGQTKQDPHKYKGSGTDWAEHLLQYGKEVDTVILFQTTYISERNRMGRYYSNLWKVTSAMDDYGNKIWANRIPETGGGGSNLPVSDATKTRRSQSLRGKRKPDGFAKGEKNSNFGKKWAGKFSGTNNPMFGKFHENNPNFGSKRTNEQKYNIRVSKIQKMLDTCILIVNKLSAGESVADIKAETGVSSTLIYDIRNGSHVIHEYMRRNNAKSTKD
jgi:hypothetical protein